MTKEFIAIQPALPTRYQAVQCLSRELGMRVKVWGGKKRQSNYIFASMEHQREYERMLYLKNILTLMKDHEWTSLQFRQFQLDQEIKAQTELF